MKEEGVWRTIRGRRIFIGKGESLGSAMSRSGKFKRSDIKEKRSQARYDEATHKFWDNKSKKSNRQAENKMKRETLEPNKKQQAEKNRINENANIEGSGKTRVQRNWNKYSEEQRREVRHEEIQKKLAEYKAKKQSNNKISAEEKEAQEKAKWWKEHENDYEKKKEQSNNKVETEKELYERAKNNPESIDPMTEWSTDWEALEKKYGNEVDSQDMPHERDLQDVVKSLNDEGSDFSWSINEYKDGKANLNVGVFMPDERGYVDRDVEFDLRGIKGNTAEGYSQIEDKIREWQDKHNSPDSFYDDDIKETKNETIKNYVEKKKSNHKINTNTIDYDKMEDYDVYNEGMKFLEDKNRPTNAHYEVDKIMRRIDNANKRGEGFSNKATNDLRKYLKENGNLVKSKEEIKQERELYKSIFGKYPPKK